ncbi:IncA family protein [Chlamydia crocodili]|uniref:IncA family protein n=1 Tax=Chlamydia crocodili TaxID=2766982 RepID=A0ABX8CDF2_9CHLA|nr:IncA family protein [Chlamydia crocodili]QVE49055.1 IncA family protein [Chlamydia crocodili]
MVIPAEIQVRNSQNQVRNISVLANNHNFIKNERQTFLAVIGAFALGIILLLVGVCVLILPLGLTSALSISLGVSGIIIGSAVIAYCLKVVYFQNAIWRKNYLEIKNALRDHGLPIPKEKNTEPVLSILFPSSLDVLTYGRVHCMGKTRTLIALGEIILGIGCIVGAVISQLLLTTWFRPGISLGLGITGAALFIGGLQDIRAFSLSAQGVTHLYLMQYEQELRKTERTVFERSLESAVTRSTLLEHNLQEANTRNLNLTTELTSKSAQITHYKNRISSLELEKLITPAPATSSWLGAISSSISSTSQYISSFLPGTKKAAAPTLATETISSTLLAITYPDTIVEIQGDEQTGDSSSSNDANESDDDFEDASEGLDGS